MRVHFFAGVELTMCIIISENKTIECSKEEVVRIEKYLEKVRLSKF